MLQSITSPPALAERDGRMVQPVQVALRHFADPAQAVVKVGDMPPVTAELTRGAQDGGRTLPGRGRSHDGFR